MPLLSVIVPVYNGEETVEKCIKSIQNQTLKDIEIICVNDGSTDKSDEILTALAANDSRIKIVTQQNMGLSGARNTGMEYVRGEYIGFVDCDDTVEDTMFETMYARAKENDCDVVFCNVRTINDKGETILSDYYSHKNFHFLAGRKLTFLDIKTYFLTFSFVAWNRIYRTAFIEENKLRFIPNKKMEDIYFFMDVYFRASGFYFVDEHFYNYVVAQNKSLMSELECKASLIDACIYIREALIRHGLYDELKMHYWELCAHKISWLVRSIMNADPKGTVYKKIREFLINHKKEIDFDVMVANEKRLIKRIMFFRSYRTIRFIDAGRECLKYVYKCLFALKHRKIYDLVLCNGLINVIKTRKLKDIHKGKRCFILGNGPSLNKCDLTKLKNEITFGFNAIYLNEEKMGYAPTYYCLEDALVAKDRGKEIRKYNGPKIKFFDSALTEYLGKPKKSIPLKSDSGYYFNPRNNSPETIEPPKFSKDISIDIKVSGTVTYYALQIAYYMGFSEVYMIGFDHYYTIPDSAVVKAESILSTEDDPNHFCKEYFGKGKSWHDPKVFRMEEGYRKAKHVFEEDGRKIYNATVGGHLEVFERVDFNSIDFN